MDEEQHLQGSCDRSQYAPHEDEFDLVLLEHRVQDALELLRGEILRAGEEGSDKRAGADACTRATQRTEAGCTGHQRTCRLMRRVSSAPMACSM